MVGGYHFDFGRFGFDFGSTYIVALSNWLNLTENTLQ